MSLPKEPRQKMINMMYLVLTALLALNVSSEILNAFRTVDQSLNRATAIIDTKSDLLMASLKDKQNDKATQALAEYWYPRGHSAEVFADSINDYINRLKQELKVAAKYDQTPGGDSTKGEDNLEASTRLMVEEKRGDSLLNRLTKFLDNLLNIDTAIGKEFKGHLPIDLRMPQTQNSNNKNDWSTAYFHMTPTIAAITILSKFQNDIRNSEEQVVEFCHRQVGEVKVIFDQYVPLVGTNSNYFMPGQELNINAGIGAYNKASSDTKVYVDGALVNLNPTSGVAEYKSTVNSPGSYSKKVHIEYFDQSKGKKDFKDYDVKYTVGSPAGANVSADATNVLYIGIPNPVTVIGGGGAGDEKVKASISQGNMVKKGAGKYDVNVETPGEAIITMNDGTKTVPFRFRVKTIPDPVAKVGNSKGGRIPVNEFKAMAGVRADLENFIFDLKYQVTGFTLIATGKAFPEKPGVAVVNGPAFDAAARAIIDKLGPNSLVMIDYIKAVGPTGSLPLQPIVFNLY